MPSFFIGNIKTLHDNSYMASALYRADHFGEWHEIMKYEKSFVFQFSLNIKI